MQTVGSKPKILIVDDEENLRSLLVKLIRREGFQPIEAADGKTAIELYKVSNPAVVISDVMMPEMDGLTLLDEIKKIDSEAIIILMTGFGNENILLKALRGGAANFFKKPFNFKEVLDVVKNMIKHRMEKASEAYYTTCLVEESKSFEMTTGGANIFPIIHQISSNLESIFPRSELINLKIGIEEMLTNAIEHGNLGIDFKEKNKALEIGKFGKLLEKKMDAGNNRYKKVRIRSELNREYFKVTVKDEGEGFDWRSLVGTFPNNFLTYNGRGIFLTKIFYDEVSYNEKGNEVSIIKHRDKQGENGESVSNEAGPAEKPQEPEE